MHDFYSKGSGNPRQNTAQPFQGKIQNKNQVRGFSAPGRLGQKKVEDARDKILTIKKNGKGDARNKIVQIQVQKGTFDARSKIKRQNQKTSNRTKNGGSGLGVSD